VFDAFANGALPVEEFDDALWSFLCARIPGDEASFQRVPLPVQYFFASRYMEWEVGNGGFAQAAFNIPQLFEAARLGYLALDLPAAADLIAQAQALISNGHARFSQDVDIGELFDEFAESALAELDGKVDDAGWWATERRSAYAVANREAFGRVA